MTIQATASSARKDAALSWSAVCAACLAVFAWAACCVLPMALAAAGLGLTGAAFVAGQRLWLTIGAALVLGAGWWRIGRRARACKIAGGCAPPSQLSVILLSLATALLVLAILWQPFVEPKALMILRTLRA
ncbi:MAG: MFS transporter permease [Phenylobacterium sp.]|nr:MFS transporter permease [Phenylobacterium sp.]ODT85522.1 MAG: hypothetical protein ABS78_19945 [Phenylobacterium sp. SCN 70-31]